MNDEKNIIDQEAERIAKELLNKHFECLELATKQAMITEFKNAIDIPLLHFIEDFSGGKNKDNNYSKHIVAGISPKQASDIQKLVGFNVSDYLHVITPSAIRHIENRHGANGQADSSMKDINDLARIKYVLNNYDSLELGTKNYTDIKNSDGSGANSIEYRKRINGSIVVVEAVPDNKAKTTYIKTMYISKYKEKETNKSQSLNSELLGGKCNKPMPNAQSEPKLPHTNSICDNQEKVNTLNKKSKEEAER